VTVQQSAKARARLTRQESRRRIVEAATELVRTGSYSELSVDAVMRVAGLGRTIFYRHFDDLGDLVQRASGEAVEELLVAQTRVWQTRPDDGADAVRRAFKEAVDVYQRHGPMLRAVAEAAAGDEHIRRDYEQMRRRFDEFAAASLRGVTERNGRQPADPLETARALNLMGENYLLDAFGREPRVSPETALQTLTEIWEAVIRR
jgi:TetR/AcrR family transcriptional regulator, ethionamide resistance regulator